MTVFRSYLVVMLLVICSVIFSSCISISASASRKRAAIVSLAKGMLDTRYRYGSQSATDGFDCSGLTQHIYRKVGISIPRTASAQYDKARSVWRRNMLEGDLVFFSTNGSGATHVGIYIGGNSFIHAPSAGKKVQTASLDSPYWQKHFVGAGAYVSDW